MKKCDALWYFCPFIEIEQKFYLCSQICYPIHYLKETLSGLRLDQAKTEQFWPDNTFHNLSIEQIYTLWWLCFNSVLTIFFSRGHQPGPIISLQGGC